MRAIRTRALEFWHRWRGRIAMLSSNSAVYNVTYAPPRSQRPAQRPGAQHPHPHQAMRPRDPHVTLPPISSLVPPSSYPAGIAGAGRVPLAAPPRMLVAPQLPQPAAPAQARAPQQQQGQGQGQQGPGGPALNPAVRLRKQCPVCGKICSRPSTLKTHYLIHTGDTPFKCSWRNCTKSFNVKSNMLRHLKSHERKLVKKGG